MKRRKFLSFLAAAPLVGIVTKALALTPKLPELAPAQQHPMMTACQDKFEIFSADEIKQIWGKDAYAEAPTFKRGGETYCVKTRRLKLTITGEALDGPREAWIGEIQRLAKEDIDRDMGFGGAVYIYAVRFCEAPIVHPETLKPYYCGWVRGARERNGWVRQRNREVAYNAVDAMIQANNL
jgi:hypothetical protein